MLVVAMPAEAGVLDAEVHGNLYPVEAVPDATAAAVTVFLEVHLGKAALVEMVPDRVVL